MRLSKFRCCSASSWDFRANSSICWPACCFAFSGERLARFTEPLGGAARLCLALRRSLVLRGARILHVPRGFGQPLDGAIETPNSARLMNAPAALRLSLLALTLLTLALLALTLLALALLAVLPLLALRCGLLAPRQLLHLLPQLFGLAPQHLLLPALLGSLLLLAAAARPVPAGAGPVPPASAALRRSPSGADRPKRHLRPVSYWFFSRSSSRSNSPSRSRPASCPPPPPPLPNAT